jgi:Glycosyltransferase family 87
MMRMLRTRWLGWILWAVVICLIVPLYLRLALDDPADYAHGGVGAGDFKAYYIAARLLARGEDIYDPQQQLREIGALHLPPDNTFYIYPSALAILLLPLQTLPLADAARVWNVFNLICFAGALWLVARAFNLPRLMGDTFPLFIILVALSFPAISMIRLGQANVLLLFLLALAVYAHLRGAARMAGIAIAFAALLKIFPLALFAWWFWKREWRAVAWGIAAMVAVLVLSALFLAVTGRDATTDLRYFVQVLPHLTPPMQWDNHSLTGFFARVGLAPTWQKMSALATSVGVLAFTGIALLRNRRVIETGLDWAVILSALLLASTMTWSTTLVLLLIPFAVLLELYLTRGCPQCLGLLLLTSYILLNAVRLAAMLGVDVVGWSWLLNLPFYGICLLWATGLWETLRDANLGVVAAASA